MVTNRSAVILPSAAGPNHPSRLIDLGEVLAQRWGLTAQTLESLSGEFDWNCAVHTTDDRRFVAKVTEGDADLPFLHWQHALLDTLANPQASLCAPRLRRSLTGADVEILEVGGFRNLVRLYEWLPGTPVSELPWHSSQLLRQWGALAARLVAALADQTVPPHVRETHDWDVFRTPQLVATQLSSVTDPEHLACVRTILGWYRQLIEPVASELPRTVVHHDLNDFNVLAHKDEYGKQSVAGVIDFTDALHSARVAEVAIAGGYAMLRKADPLAALLDVVEGYRSVAPITDAELKVLFPLAAARLVLNAVTWTHRCRRAKNTAYGLARSQHTWSTLAILTKLAPTFVESALRQRIGAAEDARTRRLKGWLAANPSVHAPFEQALLELDLSVSSHLFDELPPSERSSESTYAIVRRHAGAHVAVGRFLTSRFDRSSRRLTDGGEPATMLLGRDLYPMSGTPVLCPLGGWSEANDRGHVVIRHAPSDGPPFFTSWTGLRRPATGYVAAGSQLGIAGDKPVVVAAFAHLEQAEQQGAGHTAASYVTAWRAACPDPGPLLGLGAPPGDGHSQQWTVEQIARARDRFIARSQRSYYTQPMNLVRGEGVWLYDADGFGYLDAINNVSHVGHCNPRVSEAIARQTRRLNTNSRFVYDGIARYAQRLVETMPEHLSVVFLVCSGSEANDLALRISRQVTGRDDVIVIDGAYHGNTTAVTGISPNRYKGPGGTGSPPATTHEVERPDRYRGRFTYDCDNAGSLYANDVQATAERLCAEGRPPAAFIAESLQGTAGSIVFPDSYLARAFDHARKAGALCISDEVQVGFGRTGETFWCFQAQGASPDIVTMGKPIGNGHPLAAVVTTRDIADAFDTGMKYFNTFGGNPVSCEAGLAVLDEIASRGLQHQAWDVGAYLLSALRGLQDRHTIIGDVRGQGLYLGVELVRSRHTKEPAQYEAHAIAARMKNEGVVIYPTGVFDNVLKIKPPMVFEHSHADILTETLDGVLSDGW